MPQDHSAALSGDHSAVSHDHASDGASGVGGIFAFIGLCVVLEIIAVFMFGAVALALTALFMVPVMMIIILIISRA